MLRKMILQGLLATVLIAGASALYAQAVGQAPVVHLAMGELE
ncbi:MAG: hypothetical protein ACM33T_07955 [Solirubrobacterales bacterium]